MKNAMRAVTYKGMRNVAVKNVDDPVIRQEDDIIVDITIKEMVEGHHWR